MSRCDNSECCGHHIARKSAKDGVVITCLSREFIYTNSAINLRLIKPRGYLSHDKNISKKLDDDSKRMVGL